MNKQREDTMETTVLQYLKESIAQQRQNLADWLNGTPDTVKKLRAGPSGEQAVEEHLRTLDSALKKAEDDARALRRMPRLR